MAARAQGEEDRGSVEKSVEKEMETEIDIYTYHEQYAGRLVLDPEYVFIQ